MSSPPPEGGRRARLAAERQQSETSTQDAEVLDSRPSREPDSQAPSQFTSAGPQPLDQSELTRSYQPFHFEPQASEPQPMDTQFFEPQAFAPQPMDTQFFEPQAFAPQPFEQDEATRAMAATPPAQPAAFSPDFTQPGLSMPGVAADDFTRPGLSMDDLTRPGLSMPGVVANDFTRPGLSMPGVVANDFTQPGLSMPGVAANDFTQPGLAAPGLVAPGWTTEAQAASDSFPNYQADAQGSFGPGTTELELRGLRARSEPSGRWAGTALARTFRNRRAWGAAIAVTATVAVLAVPIASKMRTPVTVADGVLKGAASSNLTTPKEGAAGKTRVGQPDVAVVDGTVTPADARARAEAKAKATADEAALIASKVTADTAAKEEAAEKKTENGTKKAAAPQLPTSGSTGRLNNQLSGLSWVSGVYPARTGIEGVKAFGDWRGAPVDVVIDWGQRGTWEEVINPSYMLNSWGGTSFTKVFTLPPIPEGAGASMSECAAGAYNDKWRQFGENVNAAGVANEAVIRLGWEFNGDWYDWQASNPGQFAECWRQVVSSAESVAPGLLWDWNVNRGKSASLVDPRDAYPGDAYVDIIGVDSYDWYPAVHTEADWQAQYAGGYGLKFWSDFAREHGKRISVPEWGVYPGSGAGGGDNPFYIEKMHGFFREQGAHLAYEAYFNENAGYYAGSIFNPTQNPNAANKYNELFGR